MQLIFLFRSLFVLLLQRRNMSSSPEKREHLYKILVIGELGTGKTSFIKRYVHQYFSPNYRATIGVDFALKVLNWDQNTIIRLQLWDIAGNIFLTYYILLLKQNKKKITKFFPLLLFLPAVDIFSRSRTFRKYDTCLLQRSRWRIHCIRCDTKCNI